jgi:hypothetical protein
MNVDAIRRTYCAPSACTLLLGHHWDGSRWWEDGEVYQGMRLTCMRGRGGEAPRESLPPPMAPELRTTIYERARRYVEHLPPSLQGSGGSTAMMKAAVTLVRGFSLPPDDALEILVAYNARSAPPWSLAELRHKVRSAMKSKLPSGYLTDRGRR